MQIRRRSLSLPLYINTTQDPRDGISGNGGKQMKSSVHHGAAGCYLEVERHDKHYLGLSTTGLRRWFLGAIPQAERQPGKHPQGSRLENLGARGDAAGKWALVPRTVLQIESKYQRPRMRKRESKREDVSKVPFAHLYRGRLKNWWWLPQASPCQESRLDWASAFPTHPHGPARAFGDLQVSKRLKEWRRVRVGTGWETTLNKISIHYNLPQRLEKPHHLQPIVSLR